MVEAITPKIIDLQSASRDPITVYIDSRGGRLDSAAVILRLLQSSDQDGAVPCRVITVVTNIAGSAASDLLSKGDYAIAFPGAVVFHHGVRRSPADPITVEFGSALTERLKIDNNRSAMALARANESRFMFRFVSEKHSFDGVRQQLSIPAMTDLSCFVHLISEQLSAPALKLLDRARQRDERYSSMLEQLLSAIDGNEGIGNRSVAELEAAVIKKLVDREVEANEKSAGWSFIDGGGLANVNEDFFLLNEYMLCFQDEQFKKLCERWGRFALTPEEDAAISAIADDTVRQQALIEKAGERFRPVWSFLVALCHTLQQGEENLLTATDAYWLGIVDEVVGIPLRSLRVIMEFDNTGG